MQWLLSFFCELGFALHLPLFPPPQNLLRLKHNNSCLRSTWVKHAEFFWLTHVRFSFQYLPGSHSEWTQTVVDITVFTQVCSHCPAACQGQELPRQAFSSGFSILLHTTWRCQICIHWFVDQTLQVTAKSPKTIIGAEDVRNKKSM